MNKSIDLNLESSSFISSLPLSLLRFIELAALERRYSAFARMAPDQDRWVISSDKGNSGPMRFREVLRRLVNGDAPLAFLHEDEASEDPAPWQVLAYRPCSMDRPTAFTWIVGFWIAAILGGWVAIVTLGPRSAHRVLQWAYFAGVIVAAVWFSLPPSVRSKIRGRPC